MAQNPDKIPHSRQPKYRQKERMSLFTSRKTSMVIKGTINPMGPFEKMAMKI